MSKPSVFREYDIRGVADKELPDEFVETLGQAIATYVIRHSGKTICVGRDGRLSSDRLNDALQKGMLRAGVHLLNAGTVPTPVLYHSAVHCKADGAVMITGSHSAPEYNGFKIVSGIDALSGDAIRDLQKLIAAGDYETGEGDTKDVDAIGPYVEELSAQFDFKSKVKVAVDAGNGTAGPVVHKLFKKLNVEVKELNFEIDGKFPSHESDPTVAANLKDLQHAVKKQDADLGVAFDGDADRIGVVDERGCLISGDMLMLIFGREILSRKPGATFIGEVKCSQVMYDKLKELGGNPIMYKTGHSLIKAKMKQEHAELGGEMSGHMYFADRYFGYDDGIYAACRLLEILSASGKPLSKQLEGLPKVVSTPELRVKCSDEVKFKVVERVAELVGKSHQVVSIDGVRVPFERGWGLVRASNTQAALVMRFEADNKDLLSKYQEEIEAAVEQAKKEVSA